MAYQDTSDPTVAEQMFVRGLLPALAQAGRIQTHEELLDWMKAAVRTWRKAYPVEDAPRAQPAQAAPQGRPQQAAAPPRGGKGDLKAQIAEWGLKPTKEGDGWWPDGIPPYTLEDWKKKWGAHTIAGFIKGPDGQPLTFLEAYLKRDIVALDRVLRTPIKDGQYLKSNVFRARKAIALKELIADEMAGDLSPGQAGETDHFASEEADEWEEAQDTPF